MRTINLIVIHCSATPNGASLFGVDQTPVQAIDGWHKARGFARAPEAQARFNPGLAAIGYHFVVYANGAVATGRAQEEAGAHAKGHNARSLGVCMIGTDRYTLPQWATLRGLVESLLKTYPGARVVGHRDLSPDLDGDGTVEPHEWLKTCPGFDVPAWRRDGMAPPVAHLLEGVA